MSARLTKISGSFQPAASLLHQVVGTNMLPIDLGKIIKVPVTNPPTIGAMTG